MNQPADPFAKELDSIRTGEAEPMLVHKSKDLYFRALDADPYGFNNPSYDWAEEDKFVKFFIAFAIAGLVAAFVAQSTGVLGQLSPKAYGVFIAWIFVELLGKFLFSIVIFKFRIKINYIRKLALRPWRKLKTYVIPLIVVGLLGVPDGASSAVAGVIIFFFLDLLKTMLTEWHVIRRKSTFLSRAFVSWDRLEDRPYTLRYDILEDVFRFFVYLPFILIFGKGAMLVMIPNLINEFGDGLAEPVGIRFGRIKYRTRSLYYKGKFWAGKFERSVEGSAMVFLVSIIVLFLYKAEFTGMQFGILLAVLPIIMTLAEAISPHTNDGPALALVGCSTIWAVTHFVV